MIQVPEGTWCAALDAINESDHPIRVTSAGFEVQGRRGATAPIVHQPVDATLPGVIAPKDSGMTYAPIEALEEIGFNFYKPARGFAHTADGKTFRSKKTTLKAPD
jgi:hypothetical protein